MQPNDVAGPGSIDQGIIAPPSLFADVTSMDVVTLFNPLDVNFVGLVGVSKPVDVPFPIRKDSYTNSAINTESDVKNAYGLNLKNPLFKARASITNKVLIPAQKTKNLQGDVARVVGFQLTTEIMQRENNKLKLADPAARHEVELRIVKNIGKMQDIMENYESVQAQIDRALEKSNETDEAFPDRNKTQETTKRSPGRPAKSTQTA